MSTHNTCFYGELTKIIFLLSSNTLLICSSAWSHSAAVLFVGYPLLIVRLNSAVQRKED